MTGICLEPHPERAGQACPSLCTCHSCPSSPSSPWEMTEDSLEQDPNGFLVMLVIGDPGWDAISFWCGTLELKEKGHIFRVNDKN